VIFSGGEPTLHGDFEAIVRGCAKAGRGVHVYTNLERPVPRSMYDLVGKMRWRVSCHSLDAAAAGEWVQRATSLHDAGFKVGATTVHCPDEVIAVLRERSIAVDVPQVRPTALLPPVRCTIHRVYLAPDGSRYHCVGKLVTKDPSGVVADASTSAVVCQSPGRCALCDGPGSTRRAIE
ncbi:unnamed protein product, partial [marine sediment metagenome]